MNDPTLGIALGTIYPSLPPIIQRRICNNLLQAGNIKLEKKELEILENHFSGPLFTKKEVLRMMKVYEREVQGLVADSDDKHSIGAYFRREYAITERL